MKYVKKGEREKRVQSVFLSAVKRKSKCFFSYQVGHTVFSMETPSILLADGTSLTLRSKVSP